MDDNTHTTTTVDTDAVRQPSEAATVTHGSSTGLVLGILIVIMVLILGGLYVWGSQLVKEAPLPAPTPERINAEPETPRAVVDEQILNTVSTSDEISTIEADLESTNLDTLDSELIQIEAELKATETY